MTTTPTPASQPSPAPDEMRVNKADPARARLCATCEHEAAPDNVRPCNCCWNPMGDMYRRRVVPIAPASQPSPAAHLADKNNGADCVALGTAHPPSPARSDKDAELSPCPFCGAHLPHMWSLTLDGKEHSITCTECPGRAVFKSSSREQAIAAWNRRAAKAQESAPSSEGIAWHDDVRFRVFVSSVAQSQDTDAFEPAFKRLSDYIEARRATAGTTAAPTDVCAEMRARCSACGGTGDVHSIDGEWRGSCDCEASAWSRAGNAAPTEAEAVCSYCAGMGSHDGKPCPDCKGSGWIEAEVLEGGASALRAGPAGAYALPQPMSSAPHDGTEVLAWSKTGKTWHQVYWKTQENGDWLFVPPFPPRWACRWNESYYQGQNEFSHWLPIPGAPTKEPK